MASHANASRNFFHFFPPTLFLLLLLDAINFANKGQQMVATAIPLPESKPNNNLSTKLESLEKHIEQINSSISALLSQQSSGQPPKPADAAALLLVDREDGSTTMATVDNGKGQRVKGAAEDAGGQIKDGTAEADKNSTISEEGTKKKVHRPIGPPLSADATRLLCQFFVFGILFGIVCSISACSCFFRSRQMQQQTASSSTQSWVAAGEQALSRLTRIREPFAPDKPYRLKFDERGHCYASPLTSGEVPPPLPNYEQACRMPTPAELALKREAGTQKKPQPPLELRV